MLGDTFILSFNPAVGHPFRLAGTRLCALFCRELKGEPFVDLGRSRPQSLRELTDMVGAERLAWLQAQRTKPERIKGRAELLLLPLSHRQRMPVCFLGVLAPLSVPYWIGVSRSEIFASARCVISARPCRPLPVALSHAVRPTETGWSLFTVAGPQLTGPVTVSA